jgi:hypothetical protein
MPTMIRNERTARMLAGLLVVPAFLFLGIAAGVWIATLNPTGMGWDQLADALGGMLVGGFAGLCLAVIVITKLPASRLRMFTIATLAVTLTLWSALAFRARSRRAQLGLERPSSAVTADPAPSSPTDSLSAPTRIEPVAPGR